MWPRAELVIVDDAGHAANNAAISQRADPRYRSFHCASNYNSWLKRAGFDG